MQISESKLRGYLGYITVSWFGTHDLPPENLEDYHDAVINMKLDALRHDDLEMLKLAFSSLLTDPAVDCEKFAGELYGFDDGEMRQIMQYAYNTIWPNLPIIRPDDVVFTP